MYIHTRYMAILKGTMMINRWLKWGSLFYTDNPQGVISRRGRVHGNH